MTTRRPDPADAPGPHDEFWGEQTEWTPQRQPTADRTGIGAAFGRWWNALLGGGAVAGRAHGRPTASPSPSDDLDQLADRELVANHRVGRSAVLDQDRDHQHRDRQDRGRQDRARQDRDGDDSRDDIGEGAWELEPEPQPTRHSGVDPLLARLGGLAVIVTLAAPLVVGFTASGSDSQAAGSMLATVSTAPTSAFADPAATGAAPAPTAATTGELTPATAATAAGSTPDSAATASPETTLSDAVDAEADATAPSAAVAAALQGAPDPEPAETAPQVTASPCGGRYELAAGDYWIRIADAAGVSLSELLAVNDSSIDTVLVPGRSICLPVGAATPSPPTTAAPAPVPTAPQTVAAPTRSTITTATTTPTPTTTAPSRPAAVSPTQAAAIIRDVWPDELEDRALEIAWRESNHQSNVNNYCCYCLFQIHWTAHRSWLETIGVTSASQLFDPVVNANAAYTLYQRSGGFGPW
ncbi:MAG TPA: LysM peptidoglycan-binding domain-containing protein, partial [Ilumatobacteraceae bacterium]|nr:LysM peptidoglycan-binding domain-containing protein [Ilumatobacteraceae bacterium]